MNATIRRSALCFAVAITVANVPTLIADDSAKQPASRELAVGESTKVSVIAKEKFNRTGLTVSTGQHYSFIVKRDAEWKDLNIVCDANGWLSKDAPAITRNFISKAEKDRRVPAANWFELAGTIGMDEKHHFQIGNRGKDWTHTAAVDGELYLFANDLLKMYGNNHGSIEVTVTRTAEPGKNALPKK